MDPKKKVLTKKTPTRKIAQLCNRRSQQVKESDQSEAKEAPDELMVYYEKNTEFEYEILKQEELSPPAICEVYDCLT